MKRLPKIEPGELLEVIWLDAVADGSWVTASKLTTLLDGLVACYGLFITKDKEYLHICMGRGVREVYTEDDLLSPFAIPLGMIKSIKKIKLPK